MGEKNHDCVRVIVTTSQLMILRVCSIGAEPPALMLDV
jgi:hypothetical protein